MVPNVAGTGASFKGASLYYLHDKRQDGESERLSSNRVAWTSTRNLATDDPELAWKIMAATAMDQDRLKAEAGIKATGRKSSAAVYAYSIAWHPDEQGRIDRAEMLRAADESIAALGAQDRQALIVCHTDEPHPHVHVILNRVSPQDGRMLGTSNDRLKLSEWALAYRKRRGEEKLYCPDREANVEARKSGKVRDRSETPRSMEADYQAARAANDNDACRVRDQQKAATARLAQRSAQMRARHESDWQGLSEGYRARKETLFERTDRDMARVRADVARQFEPRWKELRKRHWQEHRAFQKAEESLSGRLGNALGAITASRHLEPEEGKGVLGRSFNLLTSRAAREDVLARAHRHEGAALKAAQRRAAAPAIERLKGASRTQLAAMKATFKAEREALIRRQSEERADMKLEWRSAHEERRQAFEGVRRRRESRDDRAASPHLPAQDGPDASGDFRKASLERAERLRRERPRHRGENDRERD